MSEDTTADRSTGSGLIVAGEPSPDPFQAFTHVPVQGGMLRVARSGPSPDEADAVVLAVHGVMSSLMAFRRVARELARAKGVCLLAPDLRGRGGSAHLPGPYGAAAHVADLLAVLDQCGVGRAVLVGHSMGAYLAARFATEHPDRVDAVVLLDGGLLLPLPPDYTPERALDEVLQQALFRLRMTYTSVEEYTELWRDHPAMLDEWNDDVEAYTRYDIAGGPGTFSVVVSEDAVVADCTDLAHDETTATAVDRVRAPLHLVRASHGVFNDDPLLPPEVVDAFVASRPDAHIEEVANVNHYSIVLGSGHGPRRVASVIERAIRHATAA